MGRVTDDLNRFLKDDNFGEALRLVKHLDALQRCIPDNLQEEMKNKKLAREYEK
jgi:hypothetical protein